MPARTPRHHPDPSPPDAIYPAVEDDSIIPVAQVRADDLPFPEDGDVIGATTITRGGITMSVPPGVDAGQIRFIPGGTAMVTPPRVIQSSSTAGLDDTGAPTGPPEPPPSSMPEDVAANTEALVEASLELVRSELVAWREQRDECNARIRDLVEQERTLTRVRHAFRPRRSVVENDPQETA